MWCLRVAIYFIQFILAFEAKSQCIWYDQCGIGGPNNKNLNCPYNGPPKDFPASSNELLKELCPELIDKSGTTKTCCNDQQLNEMKSNFELPKQMLIDCPSCWSNFKRYFCALTCGPDQSNYIKAYTADVKGKSAVIAIDLYVSKTTSDELFKSCQHVSSLGGIMPAMDILCGNWGSKQCTGEKWLSYMGDTDNGQTPFTQKITFEDNAIGDFRPLKIPMVPCNMPGEFGKPPCPCNQCPSSCPVAPTPIPPAPGPLLIFGLDGPAVIMGIIFTIFTIAFLVQQLWLKKLLACCTRHRRDGTYASMLTSTCPIRPRQIQHQKKEAKIKELEAKNDLDTQGEEEEESV